MHGLIATDSQRAQAVELRRLLVRIENGDGEDRTLGAAVIALTAAPPSMLCPISFMDGADALAAWLDQPRIAIINAATASLRARVQRGWKSGTEITSSDVARAMTQAILKVQLAKLERLPA